jgi:hypothetical protein
VVEKNKLNELAEVIRELTNLLPCPEGVCIKKVNDKVDCHKEGAKMCDCKCEYPEKLKGKPEECTPEQIKECHGDKEHPCEDEKSKRIAG